MIQHFGRYKIIVLFGIGELGTSISGTLLSPMAYDSVQLTHVIPGTISKASVLSFIFSFYFNVPYFVTIGFATIAAIRSETHSTRFALLAAGYYFFMALFIAGIAYKDRFAYFLEIVLAVSGKGAILIRCQGLAYERIRGLFSEFIATFWVSVAIFLTQGPVIIVSQEKKIPLHRV